MIRDLRSGPPAIAPPSSLAFSRGLVGTRGEPAPTPSQAPTHRAFTIAVTAPRLLTCKRGLAAHLAAHMATMMAPEDLSVCVVDADIESRDIGARFGVTRPVLLDVAKGVGLLHGSATLQQTITRIDPPGLSVLPTRPPEPALAPLLRAKTSDLIGPLVGAFDFVVLDAPVGLGVESPEWDATILQHVDVLLVAVTASPAAFGAALRYLNSVAGAIARGKLPSTLDVRIVLTGSDHDGSRTLVDEAEAFRRLHDLPVVGWVPQLWGRQRPDGPLDTHIDAGLRDRLSAIVHELIRVNPSVE